MSGLDVQALLDGMEGITYLLDRDARVVMIGRPNWNAFARDNGGEHLVDGAGVIGHNLLDFIGGRDVRWSYSRMIEAVASRAAPAAKLQTRCDSPTVKRELRLSLMPTALDGQVTGILVQSLAIQEDTRPAINLFDFAAMERRAKCAPSLPVLSMCSYCQQVRFPAGSGDRDGIWISAEEYYRRGGRADVRISHGMCPPCFERESEALVA